MEQELVNNSSTAPESDGNNYKAFGPSVAG